MSATKTFFLIVLFLLLFAAGVWTGSRWLAGGPAGSAAPAAAETNAEGEPLYYLHPMDPTIRSPVPAKDNMGMDYIPVYADGAGDAADLVKIDPAVVNNLGVRTAPVVRTDLARHIDTVGYIDYDERLMSHVHLRIQGWVEDLRIKAAGERVQKGDLLFRVYSPELVNAQEEYLQAVQ
ncbi:MAG: efflux RND transporter periplasmic adaptor subunit, partial [Pseudomonadota bacterium]|nr:efflux RND transporter periplasmic adaptor subunit [Pseudomonadota bacterium]